MNDRVRRPALSLSPARGRRRRLAPWFGGTILLGTATALACVVPRSGAGQAEPGVVEPMAPRTQMPLFATASVAASTDPTAVPVDSATVQDNRAARVTPIVEVVRRVGPTVVNLYADLSYLAGNGMFGARRAMAGSLGAGVLVHESGLVVTNAHVLTANIPSQSIRDRRVTVHYRPSWEGPDSDTTRSYEARVVGIDEDNDLAVLKILSDERFPAAKLGISSDLMIGETVVAVGNPYGREGSVTHGIISATNRDLASPTGEKFSDLIQTDAPLNAGNSGGPLFNVLGELIGINQAIANDRQWGKADGQGLAIPVDRVRSLLGNRFDLLYLRGLYLGAEFQEDGEHLRIASVEKGGPSAGAGLLANDEILAVAGQPVHDKTGLCLELYALEDGRSVEFTVRSGGREKKIAVEPVAIIEEVQRRLGLEFGPGSNVGGLAIRRVLSESARKIGLQAQDVLVQFGDQEVRSAKELFLVLREVEAGETVSLQVRRPPNYVLLEGRIPLG